VCCLIKLLPYILSEKFGTGNGQPREPALCQLYRHTCVPYTIIYIARMDSRRTKSNARAVARGKDSKAGLREGTGEIISLKVPLETGKRRAIANSD